MWQKKDIVNEFQRLGKRITKQRMVILDVILEQNWTDCKEVYYEAVQRDSTVGLSTVYRTIRMLEEMGAITKQSTSTIAMIGSTACNASFHFSRSFFVIPNIPLSCLFEADIPILSKSALLLGFFPHSCSLRQVFHEQGMPLQDLWACSATIL